MRESTFPKQRTPGSPNQLLTDIFQYARPLNPKPWQGTVGLGGLLEAQETLAQGASTDPSSRVGDLKGIYKRSMEVLGFGIFLVVE